MTLLPSLPIELGEIRVKLQTQKKISRFDVKSPEKVISEVIIKTKHLFFDAGSELVFTSLDVPYLIVYADLVTFNGRSIVTRRLLDNLDGVDGHDAKQTPPTRRGSGQPGNPGGPGEAGAAAQPAPRMPPFFLFARQFQWVDRQAGPGDVSGAVSFLLDGHKGGNGGNGGRGGDGTDGNKGETASPGWPFCNSGPGYGGRGGDAGPVGARGFGSNGGDASTVYFFVEPQQRFVAEAFTVSSKGGLPGKHGRHGSFGVPGKGGPAGDGKGSCSDDPSRKGADGGYVQGCVYPNIDLLIGASNKNSPAIFDYTGWNELETKP